MNQKYCSKKPHTRVFQSGPLPWATRGGECAVKKPQWGHNLILTLDILELLMKSKKKVLDAFNGSFLSNLVDGVFFNFFKGCHLKKSLGNSALNCPESSWIFFSNCLKSFTIFSKLKKLKFFNKIGCKIRKHWN